MPTVVVVLVLLAAGALAATRSRDTGSSLTATTEVTPDVAASGPASLSTQTLDPLEVTSEIAGRGPVLGGAADLTVVAGRRETLTLIDTATGDIRQVRLPRSSRPPPGLGTMFTVGPDLLINHHSAVIRLTPEAGGTPVLLAEQQRAIPTFDDATVWITDGLTSAVAATATRVALDGTVIERVRLPAVARPVAGTADGLVVSAPGGIAVVNADGGEEITGSGELVATDGRHLAWVDCESAIRCLLMLGTIDDPDRARAALAPEDVPAGYFGLPTGAFSPDGRWLAFPLYRIDDTGTLERPWITVVDVATGVEVFRAQGPFTQAFSAVPLAWSPDSLWLFVASQEGITSWNTQTREATPVELDMEPPRGLAVLP